MTSSHLVPLRPHLVPDEVANFDRLRPSVPSLRGDEDEVKLVSVNE